jgi:redox-sensitive bicupin YhaK (pirin superfamily)
MLHKDSLGYQQRIVPHQLNLMTAGRGISHSEESPPGHGPDLHGVQFWVALPEQHAAIAPAFDHFTELPQVEQDAALITVLMGRYRDAISPAATYWPMIGADIAAQRAGDTHIALLPAFEHALCVMAGEVELEGQPLQRGTVYYLGAQRERISLRLSAGARCLLLGGQPFAQPVLLWWNFVGHDTAAIEAARRAWENHDPLFGRVDAYAGARLEAPAFAGGAPGTRA